MRIPYPAIALALCALPARGAEGTASALQLALTPIDSTPLRADLVAVSGGESEALQSLVAFATTPTTDIGVRLRAIRSLPQFCPAACVGETPHTVIRQVVLDERGARQGTGVLLLRAGIEALGAMRTGSLADIELLAPAVDDEDHPNLLDHPSRDIRAVTARALGDLCRHDASGAPLGRRLPSEPSAQVRLAITAAVQALEQCPP